MKKIHFLAIPFLALTALSCQNEDMRVNNASQGTTLQATVDNQQSKVAFDAEGQFFWTQKDDIGVLMNVEGTERLEQMKLTAGAGTPNGSFSTTVVGTPTRYAVYPYDSQHSFNKDTLFYYLPGDFFINSKEVQTNFFEGEKATTPSFKAPMLGKIDQGKVYFKHIGGVLCLKVSGLVLAEQVVQISADQRLHGNFKLMDVTQSEPKLVTKDMNSNVRINFFNEIGLTDGIFYLPVPTGTYTNLTVKVGDYGDNIFVEKNFGTVTINRGDLRVLNTSTSVATSAQATQALAKGDNMLTVNGSDSEAIQIPDLKGKSIQLNYEGETPKVALTAASGNTAAQQVTLHFNGNQGSQLNLDLPNATVSLTSSAPQTFTQATVATSANTLVVRSGVTIKNLVVRSGNVTIEQGAIVESITREGEFDCTVFVCHGATQPATIQSGIRLVSTDNCMQFGQAPTFVAPVMASMDIEMAGMVLPMRINGEYGICYSETNAMPTLEQDTTAAKFFYKEPDGGKGDPNAPDFNRLIKEKIVISGLTPQKTYYCRPFLKFKPYSGKEETVIYANEVRTITTPALQLSQDEYVDLGLSVYWASRNLGATNIEDEGNLYAWGNTISNDHINDNVTHVYDPVTFQLLPEYDAATHVKGAPWHMPSLAELNELKTCYMINYTYNDKPGRLIIGENGNYIFLPKKFYTKEQMDSRNGEGWYLCYWTNQRVEYDYMPQNAYHLFDGIADNYREGLYQETSFNRSNYYMIRPVRTK